MKRIEWGDFAFKTIFNKIAQGRRLKKDDQMEGNIPFIMAGTTNAGLVNFISNPVASFPKNSITVDIFGNVFYRDFDFGAGDDTGVYWNDKIHYSKKTMLFFAIAMEKALVGKFSYGKKLRSSQSLNIKMKLPIKNGKIDFEFIDSFITDLETEQVAKLDKFLIENNLSDYNLSKQEKEAIANYTSLECKTFNLENLFGKSTRGKRLKSTDRISGTLPFVTAGETDEGVSDFIGNNVTVFSANTTTIDMFGSAKYRNYKYGGDDHIAVVHTDKLSKYASIFVTSAIHKSSYNGQFNYGRNFYAKDADVLDISLPVKVDKPDYETMETIIAAIHKLVIKDVVLYVKQKKQEEKILMEP